MQNTVSKVMASASLIALASAHGFITSPAPRMPGDAFSKACGQQMYYNQMGDNYGNVQGQLQVTNGQTDYDNYGNVQGQLQVTNGQTDYDAAACNVWLCKGFKYEDNTENVQQYTVGQEVEIEVDIRAPHTGVANVSVVSTSSGSVIGSALKSWDEYGSNAYTIPEDQEKFTVTIPDVGSDCASPGDCVIQWFWDAASIDQTYEACIDFTVGGGSGSGSTAPKPSASVPKPSSNSTISAVATNNNAASSTLPTAASSAADQTCEIVYVTVTPSA